MASDGIEPKSAKPGLGPDVDLNDESAANVIEVSGVIKWFDVAKGYGFIIPDNGMADVLLHVTCLRRDGYQTAYEGARVVCEVLPRPRTHVLSPRRAVSSGHRSNGSIGFAASASSRAERVLRTFSCTWRRCGG